jgi:hypothetical protein
MFGRGRLLTMVMAEAARFACWGFLWCLLTLIATRAALDTFGCAITTHWVFLVEVAGLMAELRRTTKVG